MSDFIAKTHQIRFRQAVRSAILATAWLLVQVGYQFFFA